MVCYIPMDIVCNQHINFAHIKPVMPKVTNFAMNTDTFEGLALRAFEISQQEVLVRLRFLSGVSKMLKPLPIPNSSLATDGAFMRFDPASFARMYARDAGSTAHAYLHVLLHNIFLHPFAGDEIDTDCWDVACDIAVEKSIAQLNLGSSFESRSGAQANMIQRHGDVLAPKTAESLYRSILNASFPSEELEAIRRPFMIDDHAPWHQGVVDEGDDLTKPQGTASEGASDQGQAPMAPGEDGTDADIPEEAKDKKRSHVSHRGMNPEDITKKDSPEDARIAQGERFADTINLDRSRDQWKNAALEMGVQMDSYMKLWGVEGSNLSMNLGLIVKRRRSYREFLRKFTVQGEHIRINEDEFDYVFYCYGLSRYGNLPLIEPLEQVEERRIRCLAIAIDTSASTKDGLVRDFLEKTISIMGNAESFFSHFNVLIVQCDAAIADVAWVHNRQEFDDYLENLEIKGLGGTDFRPVFSYVDSLIAQGELPDISGLIYLTDGFGTYPSKAPDYRTAFVFADEESSEAATVPAWAMKAVLEDEDHFASRTRIDSR